MGVRLVTGCLAVEMHTGDPLFPGDSDVDQLWLILKGMGTLTPSHAHMLSRNPYFTVRAVLRAIQCIAACPQFMQGLAMLVVVT